MKNKNKIIIFEKLDAISVVVIIFLSCIFNKIYFLRSDLNIKTYLWAKKLLPQKLFLLPIENEKNLKPYRTIMCSDRDYLTEQAEKYLPFYLLKEQSFYFIMIKDLSQKLRISLVSQFDTDLIGLSVMSKSNWGAASSLIYVHSIFSKFINRQNGVKDAERIIHMYIPQLTTIKFFFTKLAYLSKKIIFLLQDFFIIKNKIRIASKLKSRICIIYQTSFYYGASFEKAHYFSRNPNSDLYKSKVLKLVVSPYKNPDLKEDKLLEEIKLRFFLKDIFKVFTFFIYCLKKVKTLDSFRGMFFLVGFYSKYLGWLNSLREYENLEIAIIDYDMLCPKSLILALETLGIKSVGFQERPIGSFSYNLGVILDTYFMAGGLFYKYGGKNNFIYAKNKVDFGQWRLKLLSAGAFSASYISVTKGCGNDALEKYKNYVACLGYFLPNNFEASADITNNTSTSFYRSIRKAAKKFPATAFLIRPKLLSGRVKSLEEDFILNIFSGVDNVFYCLDDQFSGISYTICSNALAIIALRTSLADECVAYGKPTIYLDYVGNIKDYCSSIYSSEFSFCIAKNEFDLINMLLRILGNDLSIMQNFLQLSKRVSGKYNTRLESSVPDAITSLYSP